MNDKNNYLYFKMPDEEFFRENKQIDLKGRLDIAPFADIMTWDPFQKGQNPSRIKPFPTKDIFPGKTVMKNKDKVSYLIPYYDNERGCIGLEWVESRYIEKIEIVFDKEIENINGISIEYWIPSSDNAEESRNVYSKWQGQWARLSSDIKLNGNKITFFIDTEEYIKNDTRVVNAIEAKPPIKGTLKIRWIFSNIFKDFSVIRISAWSNSCWREEAIRIEGDKELANVEVNIEVYNGAIIQSSPLMLKSFINWKTDNILKINILACVSEKDITDETILWFKHSERPFGVLLRDILERGPVYVAQSGVYLANASFGQSIVQYKKSIEKKESTIERVKKMEDQSIRQAMSVHPKESDSSPTMISLACHNKKFVVERNGIIRSPRSGWNGDMVNGFKPSTFTVITPSLNIGSMRNTETNNCLDDSLIIKRSLGEGYIPAIINEVEKKDTRYSQRTFVAPINNYHAPYSPEWFKQDSLGISEFIIENNSTKSEKVCFSLKFSSMEPVEKQQGMYGCVPVFAEEKYDIGVRHDGNVFLNNNQFVAFINKRDMGDLKSDVRDGEIIFSGKMPASSKSTCIIYLPAFKTTSLENNIDSLNPKKQYKLLLEHWDGALIQNTTIQIPDNKFLNIIHASLINLLMITRNYNGNVISPWASADRYGTLDNESQEIISAMDLWGNKKYAELAIKVMLNNLNEEGWLSTFYTMMATGWFLQTIAKHFKLSGDKKWLKSIAPKIVKSCQWIISQCEKTKKYDINGNKLPEYGLFPPGVTGDWGFFAYRFYSQAHQYAGLRDSAEVLKQINHFESEKINQKAEEFHNNILSAFKNMQAKVPVVKLNNGTWVPFYPSILNGYRKSTELYPEGDRAAWTYDIEHGAQHLFALEVLDPDNEDANNFLNHFEDVASLLSAFACGKYYSEEDNKKEWFNRGGFSKYQHGHSRIVKIYAMNNLIKPLIRSIFNQIVMSLDNENLTFWEHGIGLAGGWNKTHTTAVILNQIYLMFLTEKNEELWIAPFLPSYYMKNGQKIKINNIPSEIGMISYEIRSEVSNDYIKAIVEIDYRNRQKRIFIRIRHSESKKMESVTINGDQYNKFNPEKEYIELPSGINKMDICVKY